MLGAAAFLAVFDRDYAPQLGHRALTFRAVFEQLCTKQSPCIVETGCLRYAGNFAGDGQSTLLFDCLAQHVGGKVYSVDISPDAIEVARNSVSPDVSLTCGDSVSFLAQFEQPIDLLYLDSFDFDANEPIPSALHHMYELCAAMPNLRPGSIVLVDDTSIDNVWRVHGRWFGKGMLIASYMKKIGSPIFVEGETQVAWML